MWTAPFSTSFFSRNKHVEIEVNPGLRFHFKMYGGFLSKLNHSNILRINRVERNEDRGTNVKCFPHFIASLLRLICWLLTRHRGGFQPLKLSLTSPSRHQLSWQPVLMIDLDMKCAAFLHISTPFFSPRRRVLFFLGLEESQGPYVVWIPILFSERDRKRGFKKSLSGTIF